MSKDIVNLLGLDGNTSSEVSGMTPSAFIELCDTCLLIRKTSQAVIDGYKAFITSFENDRLVFDMKKATLAGLESEYSLLDKTSKEAREMAGVIEKKKVFLGVLTRHMSQYVEPVIMTKKTVAESNGYVRRYITFIQFMVFAYECGTLVLASDMPTLPKSSALPKIEAMPKEE